MKKFQLAQRSGLALALEPRMMFDGAAAATAAAVAQDANQAPAVSETAAADHAVTHAEAVTGHECVHALPDDLFTDADGDTLVWSVDDLPDGLVFDADSHTISGTPVEAGETAVTVTATDPDGATAKVDITLDVAENAAPQAAGDLPDVAAATAGQEYSCILPENLFTDADGDALDWSVEGLPDGLHFDAETRTISGTPVASGDFAIKVTATDIAGAQTDVELPLDVARAEVGALAERGGPTLLDANTPPQNNYTVWSMADGVQGESYEYTIPEDLFTDADGDTLTWSVSGLPDGLHFDPATRTVSGTPTEYVVPYEEYQVTVDYVNVTVSVDDGHGGTASHDLTLRVAEAAPVDPSVSATGNDGTCVIDAGGGVTSGGSLDLFDGVSVSLDGGGNELSSMVITVGTAGAGHSLVIDGTTIPLVSTAAWADTADNYFTYRVSSMNGTTTITVMLRTTSTTEVANLIDGITYKVADADAVHSGAFDVSIDIYDESGSTEATDISATVTVDSDVNFVPEIVVDNPLVLDGTITGTDLGDATEVVYSADGHYAYVADAGGHLCVFSISDSGEMTEIQHVSGLTDLDAVTDMAIDSQAGTLYAINGDNIVVLEIGSDHTLVYSKTISLEGNGGTGVTVSGDGEQVYVSTNWGGLFVFNVDTDTGDLTKVGDPVSGISSAVASAGNYVYGIASGWPFSLVVYERQTDGSLKDVSSLAISGTFGTGYDLGVSEDGSKLFVLITEEEYDADWNPVQVTKVLAYSFNGTAVTELGTTSIDGVTDIEVRGDGEALYVTTSDGTLETYGTDGGVLTLKNTIEDLDLARGMSVSAGGELLVIGDMVYRLSGQQGGLYGQTVDFTEGLVISDANLDVLNNGDGDYGGASITVHRQGGAAAVDSFVFSESDGYTISGGNIMKDGVVVATFANGGGELTISFEPGATTEQANAVVRHWGYSHDSSSTEPSVTMEITVNDGDGGESHVEISVELSTNTPPTLDVTAQGTSEYDTAGDVVSLYTDAVVNVGESGQLLTELTLTANAASGGFTDVEYVLVDGVAIDLSRSGSGTTASGYTYTYTLSGDTGTLVITSSGGMTVPDAADLVDGLAYRNTSEAAMTGTRTFTITSLTDDGGDANGGEDTSALSIGSTVVLAVNHAPTMDIDAGGVTNPGVYYNDGSLEGFADYVNEIDVSADGTTVIVCGSSDTNGRGDSTLYVYKRDTATGALTLVQAFTQGATDDATTPAIEVDGLQHIGSAAISGDGSLVYVSGYDGATSATIVLFTRDSSTGELTYVGVQDTQTVTATEYSLLDTELVLFSSGGVTTLYTLNGKALNSAQTDNHDIVTYGVGTDGALTKLATYTGGSAELGVNQPSALAVSPDGTYAYVTNSSGHCIGVFERNASTGELSFLASISASNIGMADGVGEPHYNALSSLVNLSITPDGKYMYASTLNSGLITVFSLGSDGMPVYVQAFEIGALYPREIVVSPDGSTLYVGAFASSSLYVCSIDAATGALTLVDTVAMDSQTAHLAVGGDNIYLGGYMGASSGLNTATASPVVNRDHAGSEVVIGSGISFGDVDCDALGSYDGASVTVVRSAGADAADAFGFAEGSGLTLSGNAILDSGNNQIATFDDTDGVLTITFTSGATKTLANQVVQQITYKGTSTDTRADMVVTVSDGKKSAQAGITLVYPNEAPEVGGSDTLDGGKTGHAYSHELPSGLFTDADGDTLTWTVGGLPDGLSYDAATRIISGTPTTAGSYTVTVSAADPSGETASIELVLEVAENAVPEADADFALSNGRTGQTYSQDLSGLFTDADGDTLAWTVDSGTALPDGLSLSGTTISGTPTTAGAYTLTIHVDDGHGGTATRDITLVVTGNTAPAFNTDAHSGYTLPDVRTGTAYSHTLPEDLFTDAEGDAFTYAVSGLPSGLSYDAATRTISGTLTSPGEYSLTITVTDDLGAHGDVTLGLSAADNNAPQYSGQDFGLDRATYGAPYEMVLPDGLFTDADGDELTVTVSGLPAGLTYDAATRTISGTPTAGDASVTISVSDGYGGTADHAFALEVATPPSLTAEATGGSCSAGGGSDGDVDLFDNVAVGLDASNEALTSLVFTVDTHGAGHALVIDGQEVALVETGGLQNTTAGGFVYKVEIVDGQAVVTIDLTNSAANGAADVQVNKSPPPERLVPGVRAD